MNKLFSENTWDDYLYWQKTDTAKLKRINKLIQSIEREGYSTGIGKPEPLKHDLSGYWSRRINEEHRLIYKTDESNISIYYVVSYNFSHQQLRNITNRRCGPRIKAIIVECLQTRIISSNFNIWTLAQM